MPLLTIFLKLSVPLWQVSHGKNETQQKSSPSALETQ